MREIKFRVWNKKTNKMMCSDRLKAMCVFALEEKLNIDDFIVLPNRENYPLMQYIGLKDCSEDQVEIYENDIIKVGRPNSRFREDVAVVVFFNGAFMLKSVDFEDETIESFKVLLFDRGWYQVVGNIHENPELLENEC